MRQGPSAGTVYDGVLALRVGQAGSIDDGVLVVDGETAIPVVGQATGRAINLLFSMEDAPPLYGVGTLENDISQCTGQMGGPFAGPQPGDGGDWAGIVNPDQDAICDACLRGCPGTLTKCTKKGGQCYHECCFC